MEPAKGKARITITLRQDLLPLLDHFVDGKKIRNRSHAIEYILGQRLGWGIEQAVIFTGGSNTSTSPFLTTIAKRMVVSYTFDKLKESGIRDVIIVIDSHSREIEKTLGSGARWGMRLRYVVDEAVTGTAHALALVQPLIHKTFLLLYGDILADVALSDVVEYHQALPNAIGTVALTYKRAPENYGVARLEGNKIVEYVEKPGKDGQHGKHGLVNAGIYIFEPEIFKYLTSDARWLEENVLPRVAADGKLYGYPFHGLWFDVSSEEGRQRAETSWKR